MPMDSLHVRGQLVETLRLDLIGPDNDHAFANELLPEPPMRPNNESDAEAED